MTHIFTYYLFYSSLAEITYVDFHQFLVNKSSIDFLDHIWLLSKSIKKKKICDKNLFSDNVE